MKQQGFKKLLDEAKFTPYRLSKLINYNMSSVYKLYSGETKFYNIQLWVAKRIANVLFVLSTFFMSEYRQTKELILKILKRTF